MHNGPQRPRNYLLIILDLTNKLCHGSYRYIVQTPLCAMKLSPLAKGLPLRLLGQIAQFCRITARQWAASGSIREKECPPIGLYHV